VAQQPFTVSPSEFTVVVNRPYEASLTTEGATGAVQWELAEGTLPDGLSLSTQGAVTGRTFATGDHVVTLRATDAEGHEVSHALTLHVETRAWVAYQIIERETREWVLNLANLAAPLPAATVLGTYSDTYSGQFAVAFSPDGKYVAYTVPDGNGTCELRILDLRKPAGTSGTRVGDEPTFCVSPEWSPDSTQLLVLRQPATDRYVPSVERLTPNGFEHLLPPNVMYERTGGLRWVTRDTFAVSAALPGVTERVYVATVDAAGAFLIQGMSTIDGSLILYANPAEGRFWGRTPNGDYWEVVDLDDQWTLSFPTWETVGTGGVTRMPSPDGRWVFATHDGLMDVYPMEQLREASPEELVTGAPAYMTTPVGSQLFFSTTMPPFVTLQANGGRAYALELAQGASPIEMHWPDGAYPVPGARGSWMHGIASGQIYAHVGPLQDDYISLLSYSSTYGYSPSPAHPAIAFSDTASVSYVSVEHAVEGEKVISPALDATRTGVANRNPEWTGDGTFVLYVMARAASDDSGYAAEGLWATRVEPSLGTPVNISNTNRDCAAQEGWPPSTCPEVGYTSWVQP